MNWYKCVAIESRFLLRGCDPGFLCAKFSPPPRLCDTVTCIDRWWQRKMGWQMKRTYYIYVKGPIFKNLRSSHLHPFEIQVICTALSHLQRAGSVSLPLLVLIHQLQQVWENHSFLLWLCQGKRICFPSVDALFEGNFRVMLYKSYKSYYFIGKLIINK